MKEEDLGRVDIDEEANVRRGKLYIPNWFSVEVKTGVRRQDALCSCLASYCMIMLCCVSSR